MLSICGKANITCSFIYSDHPESLSKLCRDLFISHVPSHAVVLSVVLMLFGHADKCNLCLSHSPQFTETERVHSHFYRNMYSPAKLQTFVSLPTRLPEVILCSSSLCFSLNSAVHLPLFLLPPLILPHPLEPWPHMHTLWSSRLHAHNTRAAHLQLLFQR